MNDEAHTDDFKATMEQKRFLNEIEQGIQVANREIIHDRIAKVTKDTVLSFSIAVARLRARYLEAAFRIGTAEHGDPPDQKEVQALQTQREMYEEAKMAFEALRDAIERGYVDVSLEDDEPG